MPGRSRILSIVLVFAASVACQIFTPRPSAPTSESTGIPGTSIPSSATSAPSAPSGLSSNGPTLVFAGKSGLWVANPDGSFLTHVTDIDLSQSDVRRAISPKGDRLAAVVPSDGGLDLLQIMIPTGETVPVAHLLDIPADELVFNPTGAVAFAYYAITGYDSLDWQPPDGDQLAFMGAINGPTSDLYRYDTTSGKVTQLTDGPSQAILPIWSPDGQYILHYGVSWVPPFGGAIVGYNRLDGVWAVRASDAKVITEPKPKAQRDDFAGWLDDAHYLTFDRNDSSESIPACADSHLRSVDLASGKISQVMPWDFDGLLLSPLNKALIFDSKSTCAHSPGDGTFLLMPGQTTPAKLMDDIPYEYHWLPESQVIQAYPQALFTIDGTTRYAPPKAGSSFQPAISRKGYEAWELIENQQGHVLVKLPTGDWKTIQDTLVDGLIWDPLTGDTLFIAAHDGSLYAASYPDFTPRLVGKIGSINQAMWLERR